MWEDKNRQHKTKYGRKTKKKKIKRHTIIQENTKQTLHVEQNEFWQDYHCKVKAVIFRLLESSMISITYISWSNYLP